MRIELRDVSKRFGPVQALRGITLAIESGRRVALIGPNGSGKSTLTRAVMGLVACDGVVRVDGKDPLLERVAVVGRMAYVPQIAPQLRAPVGELVRAVARTRGLDERAVEALARRLGFDLAAVRKQPLRTLSGGMKQRTLLALALASGASLLILDEPTASLDAPTRERFFDLFEEVAGDATLLLCSHRLEEIRRLVQHVVALEEGRLVYDGPAEAYLDARATTVLEVLPSATTAADALTALGFRLGGGGWWSARAARGDKMRLLRELQRAAPDVQNLLVRDLDSLHGDGGGPCDAH